MKGRRAGEWRAGKAVKLSESVDSRWFANAANASFHQRMPIRSILTDHYLFALPEVTAESIRPLPNTAALMGVPG